MSKELPKAYVEDNRIISENSDGARELYNQARFGTLLEDGRVQFSVLETLYLVEKAKIAAYNLANKNQTFDQLTRKFRRKTFHVRYAVFRDLRNRGYIVKTALKFGADFRVYDRGIKPGEDHAKWVVYPTHETDTLTWHDFSAKNRVAHSTKKHLLMGVVDDEGDVSYWEIRWLRP